MMLDMHHCSVTQRCNKLLEIGKGLGFCSPFKGVMLSSADQAPIIACFFSQLKTGQSSNQLKTIGIGGLQDAFSRNQT